MFCTFIFVNGTCADVLGWWVVPRVILVVAVCSGTGILLFIVWKVHV